MTKILLLAIVAAAALGFIIGVIKGFTKVKNWAFEYVAATVGAVLVANFLTEYSNKLQFVLVYACAVAFFLLFAFLTYRAKKFFEKGIKKRKLRSYYEQYRDRMENDEAICDALEEGDEHEYQKHVKKNFKEKSGAIGVANRIVGGLALAVKGAVLAGVIIFIGLTVYHFVQLDVAELLGNPQLAEYINEVYAGPLWAFAKQFFLDIAIVAIVCACLKTGFEKCFITPIWTFIMIGLVGFGIVVAFHLAFRVDAFIDLAKSLEITFGENLSNITEPISAYVSVFTALNICKGLVMIVLFLLLLIPIIFVGAFGPKLVKNAREGVVFKTIDGIIGALAFAAIIGAIVLAVGAVLFTVGDLAFMAPFSDMFMETGIAKFIYQNNVLNELKFIQELPIRGWLTAK